MAHGSCPLRRACSILTNYYRISRGSDCSAVIPALVAIGVETRRKQGFELRQPTLAVSALKGSYAIHTCCFRENGGKPLYRIAGEGLMVLIRKRN
jgi:hypothetical protein